MAIMKEQGKTILKGFFCKIRVISKYFSKKWNQLNPTKWKQLDITVNNHFYNYLFHIIGSKTNKSK